MRLSSTRLSALVNMEAIYNYLWDSREWLFSGAGVTIVTGALAALGWLVSGRRGARAKHRQPGDRGTIQRPESRPRVVDLSDLRDFHPVERFNQEGAPLRHCEFCRRSERSVRTLFTRAGSYICDECLDEGAAARDSIVVTKEMVLDIAALSYQLASTPNLAPVLRDTLQSKHQVLVLRASKRRLDRPGDVVAGAELIRRIGHGNFANVWEARRLRAGRDHLTKVAVKIFDQQKTGTGLMLWRFHRGIKAMQYFASLGRACPASIVRLYDIADDYLSFSMEYLPGKDLQHLPEQGWTLKRRIQLFSQTAAAVAFAHSHGIIHRDIKPANIVLDAKGDAVLTDFDIVDMSVAETRSLHTGGLGTPLFAAPEQLSSTAEALPTADIYSLGKLLYFMITQSAPPMGSTELGHVPAYMKSGVLRHFQEIVCKAIQMDPRNRYQRVDELIEAVARGYATHEIERGVRVDA